MVRRGGTIHRLLLQRLAQDDSASVRVLVPVEPWGQPVSPGSSRVIQELIDAYDVLVSDSMNEFERFSWAYLLLVGQSIDPQDSADIKRQRIFQNLKSINDVGFLTKDINKEFIEFMADRIKREIHDQSFVPNLQDLKVGGAASGVAIEKFIYIMEYLAADKESEFRNGLYDRIEMLNSIAETMEIDKITFTRNLPSTDMVHADVYMKLDGRGISRKTLMEQYMPFIENPEKELEEFKKEQEDMIQELPEPQMENEQSQKDIILKEDENVEE
jgi:SPP1 family phage portal protein